MFGVDDRRRIADGAMVRNGREKFTAKGSIGCEERGGAAQVSSVGGVRRSYPTMGREIDAHSHNRICKGRNACGMGPMICARVAGWGEGDLWGGMA